MVRRSERARRECRHADFFPCTPPVGSPVLVSVNSVHSPFTIRSEPQQKPLSIVAAGAGDLAGVTYATRVPALRPGRPSDRRGAWERRIHSARQVTALRTLASRGEMGSPTPAPGRREPARVPHHGRGAAQLRGVDVRGHAGGVLLGLRHAAEGGDRPHGSRMAVNWLHPFRWAVGMDHCRPMSGRELIVQVPPRGIG
eukprot:gene17850-biopygen9420